jgi:uncharacterized phage protein (TIGR01671 family)
MNDRFKFRVWSEKDHEYLDAGYYEAFWLSPDGVVHAGLTEWNGIQDEYKEIPQKQLIVEQCTGLRDKNGKLIYEGDVIQENGINRYIHWHDGGLCYSVRYCSKCHWSLRKEDVENAEIIGNIHESEGKDE